LLLGLRARGVSSRRDGSKIFLQISPLNTLRDSTLNTTVHALILCTDFGGDFKTQEKEEANARQQPALTHDAPRCSGMAMMMRVVTDSVHITHARCRQHACMQHGATAAEFTVATAEG
jgi:hypothetical protein